ncbi:hypothetical protein ACTFIY_003054 [Dictyostelium cf. discoideum]
MVRIGFFKFLFLSFLISICLMSSYLLISINNIENKNDNVNINTIKSQSSQETSIENIFKPQKKLVVLEREVIKEVIKEVCANDIITHEIKNSIKNQDKTLIINEESENSIENYQGFKDKQSMINYFLTYQNYYNIEKYKDIIYIDTQKYNISKYSFPELTQKQSTFTPTIKEIINKIESIKTVYQNSNINQQQQYQQQYQQQRYQQQQNKQQLYEQQQQQRETLRGDINEPHQVFQQKGVNGITNKVGTLGGISSQPILNDGKNQQNILNSQSNTFNEIGFNRNNEHMKYAKLLFRARVWSDFFSDYWREKDFIQFSENNGIIPFQPPKLSLPLDTSKPLLSKPYLFLHIAKSGGSSMYFHFNRFFGSGVLQQWAHPNPNDYLKVKQANNVVIGHFDYGIHYVLNEETQKSCNYLTILRDPVERVISHYFYHLFDKGDPEHSGTKNKTLEDWIISSVRGNNEMTRVLSGITKEEEFKPSNETFLMALYHLRSMKFVGITERFTETLALLKFYTGFDNPLLNNKKNVGKPGRTPVSHQVIEKIKERNWMDILLYEEASKMFERQIDIVGRDNFKNQLNKIQIGNK